MLPSWENLSWLPWTSLGIISYPPSELKTWVKAIILVGLGLLAFVTSRNELPEEKAPVFLSSWYPTEFVAQSSASVEVWKTALLKLICMHGNNTTTVIIANSY